MPFEGVNFRHKAGRGELGHHGRRARPGDRLLRGAAAAEELVLGVGVAERLLVADQARWASAGSAWEDTQTRRTVRWRACSLAVHFPAQAPHVTAHKTASQSAITMIYQWLLLIRWLRDVAAANSSSLCW